MANYATLKAAINAVIRANGNKEITGTVLNETLTAMVNSLGANYQFAGVATPSTNPGTPDQNVFYLAGQAGTYTNFNSIVLTEGVSVLKWNGSWSSETVVAGDGVFDISAYKATGGTLATFADLSAALDGGNNIPQPFRKGGMSVKFIQGSVQSPDNKYVQYRLMTQSFSTTVTDWQRIVDSNVIDVNVLMGNTSLYTLSTARACVPAELRKVGVVLRYRKTYTSIEEVEFVVGDTSDTYWNNDSNWNVISDNIHYREEVTGSISNYKDDGYYNILPWTSLDDRPTGLSISAVLVVFHHSSTDNGIQIVIGNDGNMWQRVIPWSGTPTAWNKVTKLKLYNSNVTGSISNYKEDGYYNILSWTTLTDRPEGLTASAVLFVFHHSSTDNGIQVIISNDGNVWQRVIPWEGAAGAWNKLTGSKVAKTKWFALGDSITRGYYSDSGDGGITENNYPYYVSLINSWECKNYGTGGSGYVHHATVNDNTLLTNLGLDKPNAKEIVDAVDFSNADIVTLAWGINDWHYDNIMRGDINTSTVGDGSLVGNMRYVIEKILTSNSKAKIVVLLPMNSSMFGGNFSSNWGFGLDLYGNGTLQQYIDAEKSVCDFYGIQYVELSKNSIVNRYNIEDVLLDGLHPAIDVYLPLAKCISKNIMFE